MRFEIFDACPIKLYVFCFLSFFVSQAFAGSGPLTAADITLEKMHVPYGNVWESRPIPVNLTYNVAGRVDRVAIIVTAPGKGYVNVADTKQLPRRIYSSTDKSGIEFTVTGDLHASWNGSGYHWRAHSFAEATTHLVTFKGIGNNQVRALADWEPGVLPLGQDHSVGTLSGHVRLLIHCNRSEGCTFPENFSLDPLVVRLYAPTIDASEDSYEPILSGRVPFHFSASCTFVMEKTRFDNLLVRPQQYATALLYSGENFKSRFNISCTADQGEKRGHILLTPTNGTPAGYGHIAKSNKDGIGVIYRLHDMPRSCGDGMPFVRQDLKEISPKGEKYESGTDIYWGICQYENGDKIKSGPFKATINYRYWID